MVEMRKPVVNPGIEVVGNQLDQKKPDFKVFIIVEVNVHVYAIYHIVNDCNVDYPVYDGGITTTRKRRIIGNEEESY